MHLHIATTKTAGRLLNTHGDIFTREFLTKESSGGARISPTEWLTFPEGVACFFCIFHNCASHSGCVGTTANL